MCSRRSFFLYLAAENVAAAVVAVDDMVCGLLECVLPCLATLDYQLLLVAAAAGRPKAANSAVN